MSKEIFLKNLSPDEANMVMGACVDDPTKEVICVWKEGYTSLRIPYTEEIKGLKNNVDFLYELQTAHLVIIRSTAGQNN